MIVKIDKSFQKDLSKISDTKIKQSIIEILKNIQEAENLSFITNLKKLIGYKEFYRIRLGNYRIGIRYTDNHELVFIRFLYRKEIYNRWP